MVYWAAISIMRRIKREGFNTSEEKKGRASTNQHFDPFLVLTDITTRFANAKGYNLLQLSRLYAR